MIDPLKAGITINGKHSFSNFGAVMTSHSTGAPEPFFVRETVPYMDGFYEFSAITGELTCTQRVAEYTFEIEKDNEEDLEYYKSLFFGWLMSAVNVSIFDDYDDGYHMVGSIAEAPEWEPIDPWCGEIKVRFVCQPKRIYRDGSKKY